MAVLRASRYCSFLRSTLTLLAPPRFLPLGLARGEVRCREGKWERMRVACLFHIAFQDQQQVMKLLFAFRLRLRAFNAMMEMGMNN